MQAYCLFNFVIIPQVFKMQQTMTVYNRFQWWQQLTSAEWWQSVSHALLAAAAVWCYVKWEAVLMSQHIFFISNQIIFPGELSFWGKIWMRQQNQLCQLPNTDPQELRVCLPDLWHTTTDGRTDNKLTLVTIKYLALKPSITWWDEKQPLTSCKHNGFTRCEWLLVIPTYFLSVLHSFIH